ncbi:MAG: hypothetical protein JO212_04895 [Acetobacteraceae bacterium]|nr:hypothetical protein [Acetobacteraceae bacterium]
MDDIRARLKEIDFGRAMPADTSPDLTVFYHHATLQQVCALRAYLLEREARGRLDSTDQWIRMVAINRLTGHSPGFFSGYTLPPNQAVSVEAQRKINEARRQIPPPRDIAAIISKKSSSLLADGAPPGHPPAFLTTGPAYATPEIRGIEAALIVTSPPFLDIVDYEGDNWLRCWFAGIDAKSVAIARYMDVRAWEGFVRQCFHEFANILRPGALVAFEVSEVRGGKILLERHVASAVAGLPFEVIGVMLNQQKFTKTANCWGVANNRSGTNTNRIVLAQFRGKGSSRPA